jgi:HD-GYP domain-containing protein (c-di-GMP phosphodiesterase class II)
MTEERLHLEPLIMMKSDKQDEAVGNFFQRQINHTTAVLREWRNLRKRVGGFSEIVEQKLASLEINLSDYRLVISGLNYKAADTDRKVWDLYGHILTENTRLVTQTKTRPLFLLSVHDLQVMNDSWEKLCLDQEALTEMLQKAPTDLVEYNSRQLEKDSMRREESHRQDIVARVSSARRSLDLAIGYIQQLHREGRVTFGSQVLQLDDAQVYWNERLNKIFEQEKLGEISSDEVVLGIYNLETLVRESPTISMRIREIEEKFTRLINKHDMLVSYGKTVISQKEISRMSIKLHEQVPQLWASGQRMELEHAIEVIENFINTYENTIESEVVYLERRRPGLTRALAAIPEAEDGSLTQVSAMARSLIAAIDSRDRNMRGHSEAVSRLSVQIARTAKWQKNDLDYLMIAALLHDVGKISIPEHILTKTDPLTEDEWHTIQMHPFYGAQIIKPIESLARIVPWIYHHQERWDGRGYPDHLTGRQIPMAAGIIAVAEAYSVMTIDLPNRPAMSPDEALNDIQKASETQFSPEAVEALADVVAKEKEKNAS